MPSTIDSWSWVIVAARRILTLIFNIGFQPYLSELTDLFYKYDKIHIRLGNEKILLLKTSNYRNKSVYSFIYIVNVFSILAVKYYDKVYVPYCRWNCMYMYLSKHCLRTLRGWGRRWRNRWTWISLAINTYQYRWRRCHDHVIIGLASTLKINVIKTLTAVTVMIRDRIMDGFIGSNCMGRCELWRCTTDTTLNDKVYVSDLKRVAGFLPVLWFLVEIQLTTTIWQALLKVAINVRNSNPDKACIWNTKQLCHVSIHVNINKCLTLKMRKINVYGYEVVRITENKITIFLCSIL